MTANQDYRKYLEEKFKSLQSAQHGYFNEVHDKLDVIEEQTTKTNNRVTKIEDDLTEYRMVKKYPKTAILVFIITVMVSVYGFMRVVDREVSITVGAATDTLRTEIRNMDGISPVKRNVGGEEYVRINNKGITDTLYIR